VGIVQAIVYGLIQGLTEFLPISSTAHIRIVPSLLGWEDPGAAFTAIIQLGTVAAVLIYFAKDIGKALAAWWFSITGKKEFDKVEARLAWAVFIGSLPIIAIGLAFHAKIETSLRSLYIVAISLILMGIVMLLAEKIAKHKRKVNDVGVNDGVIVGLWQCLSLIPGMSRSGSTISGALFQGFDRVAAARFSFLLSIPSVFGAGVYEAYKGYKEGKMPQLANETAAEFAARQIHWGPTVLATIISFVVGYAAITYFMQYLQRRGIAPFVWYRVALGILILFLVSGGYIKADAGAKSSPKTNPDLKASRAVAPLVSSRISPTPNPLPQRQTTVGRGISPTPNPLPQRQTTLRDGAPEAYVLEEA
jgi:undecaprenyl-diphosphatase